MGIVNGQDTSSLLSRRQKNVMAERRPGVKKQELPSSVVKKIERILSAYKETLAEYQDVLEELVARVGETPVKMPVVMNSETAEGEYAVSVIMNIEQLKTSIATLSEEVNQISLSLSESAGVNQGAMSDESDYTDVLANYNKNLTEIRKRLDDLIKFIGKVDGSIIESLKSHTNENRDVLMNKLTQLRELTDKRTRGLKLLMIFNIIFALLNIGGIAFLILMFLDTY